WEIAIDVDVVDGERISKLLTLEPHASRERRVVELELHVVESGLLRVVEEIRLGARAVQHLRISGLHFDLQSVEHVLRIELLNVDRTRERQAAPELRSFHAALRPNAD